MSSNKASFYLISFFMVIALALFLYWRAGIGWQIYVLLLAAVVYLVLFFLKILKLK
tara:strand:- start:328 stop:495 length:168 start_codon:yes stop_codon:yes gene_type:complete